MLLDEVIMTLHSQANPANVAGMARFGINPHNTLGISMPFLRSLARQCKRDHALAIQLWDTGIHEARILAGLVADPRQVDETLMERWVLDFDSWDVCDQVCLNLFRLAAHAWDKALAWPARPETFVRRAGFVLMATLAVHGKKILDERFHEFFPAILAAADDERNFVKKAVNWALRQIGKRSRSLNTAAVEIARQMQRMPSKAARWNASDVLKELTAQKTLARLKR
jgi:3-methyladenine DNA glycosylase AlkD